MKHLKTITLLVAVSFIFIFSATVFAADSPSIVMEETSHHFGPVKKGEVVRHEFGFTNKGSGVLKIKEFYLSWPDATTISASSAEIKPGESGSFSITMDTSTFDGEISRTFGVETNDPENEDILLIIYLTITE